jgi:hypothetical protein
MKKLIASLLVIFAIAASASAATEAVLSGIKGKVEVKPANGAWAPAKEGMKIDLRTTLSTGFDSTATIAIDKSKIVVKPLTRLTLDKLLEQSSGSVSASMYLRVGAVQASVKAAVPGTPQDFKVQSPYSTASVRGTEFSFDGFYLRVTNGVVVLVPGRPVRDVQATDTGSTAAGGEGFSGATPIEAANAQNGVAVSQGQQAALQVFYAMDTGAQTSSGQGQTGTSQSTSTTPPPAARSGVVITVTPTW